MASFALKPRTTAAALTRETDPRAALPYARHVTDQIVGLDTGALMMAFRLDGASFETADVRDLNDWHAKLNSAWRNLADDQLAVWHHLIRREHHGYPAGAFRSAFAAGLDARYGDRLGAGRMFVNELYVTLVLHPGREVAERAGAWLSRARHTAAAVADDDAVKRLEDAGRDLGQYLARYGVRPLGLYEHDGLWFSEPMELLRLVLTGRHERVPLVRGHLGSAIYTARVIFGREALLNVRITTEEGGELLERTPLVFVGGNKFQLEEFDLPTRAHSEWNDRKFMSVYDGTIRVDATRLLNLLTEMRDEERF